MSQEKFQQAINLFKAGNKKQAGESLLEVVKVDPGNADAWYGLALCTDVADKKKYFLEKVLQINPQYSKALQLLEKINSANRTTPPIVSKKTNYPITNFVAWLAIGVLILCVAWLFYRVSNLEKSLVQTQNELVATQTELGATRSTLGSTIDTLLYVQALAENANRYAHSHNNYSDNRLKKDVSEIQDPLNGILSLHGVTFFWNTSSYPDLDLSNDQQIGFIAQELEKVYPQLVNTDKNGFKTVDYAKLIPVLVEAIKQQQLMIVDLQQQIIELQQNSK